MASLHCPVDNCTPTLLMMQAGIFTQCCMALKTIASWALCHDIMLSCVVSYQPGVFAQYSALQRGNTHKPSTLLPSYSYTYSGMHTDPSMLSLCMLALYSLYGVESRESSVESNLLISCCSLLQHPPEEIVDKETVSACYHVTYINVSTQ